MLSANWQYFGGEERDISTLYIYFLFIMNFYTSYIENLRDTIDLIFFTLENRLSGKNWAKDLEDIKNCLNEANSCIKSELILMEQTFQILETRKISSFMDSTIMQDSKEAVNEPLERELVINNQEKENIANLSTELNNQKIHILVDKKGEYETDFHVLTVKVFSSDSGVIMFQSDEEPNSALVKLGCRMYGKVVSDFISKKSENIKFTLSSSSSNFSVVDQIDLKISSESNNISFNSSYKYTCKKISKKVG